MSFASGRRSALVVALWISALVACRKAKPVLSPYSPLAVSVREMMECHECVDGERDSVVARGLTAVPPLRDALLRGPPDDRISDIRRGLVALHPATTGSGAVIDLQLEDFRSLYRVRAALALGAIGGPLARQALCSGQRMNFPRLSVQRAINSALIQTGGAACP